VGPSGSTCATREILKARLRADVKVYADAIGALQRHSMAALAALREDTAIALQKRYELAEHARIAYEDSRKKLDDHIATHRCA